MLSVVIPAYNEEDYLGTCLECLTKQTLAEPFEVIVVDNNSTDATAAVAKTFADRLTLKVLFEPQRVRGNARSRGFAEASGEVIFSMDADAEPAPEWMQMCMTALRNDPHCVAVTGQVTLHDCPPLTRLFLNGWYAVYGLVFRLRHGYPQLMGAFAVRRDAYLASGGFHAGADFGEDLLLTKHLSAIGHIAYVPERLILFSGRRFRKSFWHGAWSYVVPTMHRSFLGKKKTELKNIR